ncbi:MAG: chemotaxis protein CheW [Verrucomicrobiota bacterium]
MNSRFINESTETRYNLREEIRRRTDQSYLVGVSDAGRILLPVAAIKQVRPLDQVRKLPKANRFVKGLTVDNDRVVPVIDPSVLLGKNPVDALLGCPAVFLGIDEIIGCIPLLRVEASISIQGFEQKERSERTAAFAKEVVMENQNLPMLDFSELDRMI